MFSFTITQKTPMDHVKLFSIADKTEIKSVSANQF